MHGVGGVAQERHAGGIGPRHLLQQRPIGGGVAADVRGAGGGVALRLERAGARHPLSHLAAALRGRRQDEIGGGDGRHLDMQIDAVDQRARQPHLIVGGATRVLAVLAHEAGLGRMAAAAGIHGRHQHEARRIGDPVIGARDRDLAGLERLAQRIEHARLELRQFVEEQDAMMGERDLAGLGPASRRPPAPPCWRNDAGCGTAADW